MARRRSKKQSEETLVDLVEARDQASDFFERNQRVIFGILVGIVVLVGGVFAYSNFYKAPREARAKAAMAEAQIQFERDSFALALENPGGGNDGFLDIIDRYGNTKAGNLAQFYTGVSWMNLGRHEAAIEHLKKYNGKGSILPIVKFGALADCYGELEDFDAAKKYYEKAVKAGENDFLVIHYLKKLGQLSEYLEQPQEALKYYQRIKSDYPKAPEAQDMEKYISRVRQ